MTLSRFVEGPNGKFAPRQARSYRSMASNCLAPSERNFANFAGPSGVVITYFSAKAGTGTSASLAVRSCLLTLNFSRVSARDSRLGSANASQRS